LSYEQGLIVKNSVQISIPTQVVCLVFVLLLVAVTAGCLPRESGLYGPLVERVRPPKNTGRLNVFLTLEDKQGPSLKLQIDSLEILAKDLWLPLNSGAVTIDSMEIGSGQHFLGGEPLPPGQYQKIRMTVSKGILRKADGSESVLLSKPQQIHLTLARGLSLNSGDSKTLHFTWDLENSIRPDNSLSPVFFVALPLRDLPVNQVFVACPDIDTVFVVRADKNWVVDSIGLTGRPTYLAIDPFANRERLYVLTPGEKAIKVVDLSSYRVIDSYPTLDDEVTYMTTSPDGQWAYLLHERSGYLSRMNLQTGQIGPRMMLGSRPVYVAYLDSQKLLAISLSLTNKVLLLNTENLLTVRTISTGSNPEGLLVLDNQLYIAESGDASVTNYGLSTRGSQSRLMVGFGPRRLVNAENQIFVSNYSDGSLSSLLPGQLGSVQQIYGLGQPLEMVFDRLYRQLYVADDQESALTVINGNSNQIVGHIYLGARPLGLVEIQ
jgi:DNA-binding beta-propeller fold protein YncE